MIEACKSLVKKGLIIQKSGARNISVFAINDEPNMTTTSDEKSPVTKSHTHKDNIFLLKNKDKKTSSATKEKTFAEYQADCLAERIGAVRCLHS